MLAMILSDLNYRNRGSIGIVLFSMELSRTDLTSRARLGELAERARRIDFVAIDSPREKGDRFVIGMKMVAGD